MLDQGEIDVLIGAREPNCYQRGSKNVARLWPNYPEIERDYYRRTGIFPIMHPIVIRRDVYEKNRWLAQSLSKAFMESKALCQRELGSQSALKSMLPWLIRELEDTVKFMGEDYWPYGLESNRKTLETFIAYTVEQGLAESPVSVGDLFAPETLDTARI